MTISRDVLLDIADKEPLCLDEPELDIRFQNFGDSALEFLSAIWCIREDYLKLKKKIMHQIKERFDEEGIEIPFPHRTLYIGSVTEYFQFASSKSRRKTGQNHRKTINQLTGRSLRLLFFI